MTRPGPLQQGSVRVEQRMRIAFKQLSIARTLIRPLHAMADLVPPEDAAYRRTPSQANLQLAELDLPAPSRISQAVKQAENESVLPSLHPLSLS